MGFVLSIFFFVTYYLTPVALFGPLASYHIQSVLAILLLFVSLPKLPGSIILKTPQTIALIGLATACFLSVLFGLHWAWGAAQQLIAFLPNLGFGYLLVCLHFNSKRRLQFLVLMLLFICFVVIAHGGIEMLRGLPESGQSFSATAESVDQEAWLKQHPYLFPMRSDAGDWFVRLRGQGVIGDPNDFAQLLVCVAPLTFFFWRAGKTFQNVAIVVLPVCVLLFGVYLTHSRGALLALTMVAIVAARRRIGTLPALLLMSGLFVAAMALHFTGGRGISAESGADRTELWSGSLQVLKAHPWFGIGAGSLSDYIGQTAHNSVAVCAAELGVFGFFFWSMFLFSTCRDALAIASPGNLTEGEAIVTEDESFPQMTRQIEAVDKAEVNRLGSLVVLSLTGFLVAGWFLSRAFALTLFLLGGVAEVVYEMALQRGMIAPRKRLARVLPYSAGLAVLLLCALYLAVRVLTLMH